MRYFFSIFLFGFGASTVHSQLMEPAVSPIVHADRSVTFALHAPNADSVHVKPHPGEPLMATRDSSGTWHARSGPLEPGVHFYSFSVDGLIICDPVNPFVHGSLFHNASGVVVPGDTPHFAEEQDVPRGQIHLHRHVSELFGDTRGYAVYTPPGYEAHPEKRYPTLYLLHGYSDHERTWSNTGRAGVIMDNLIAEGTATPMVIVMPYGYAPPAEGDNSGEWWDWFSAVSSRLEPYIVTELRKRIEVEYRVGIAAQSWAIAGLSMGGGQSLFFGLKNTDVYSWIGAFSSAIHLPFFEPLLSEATKVNEDLALLWVGCGTEDFLYESNNDFLRALDKNEIVHVAQITSGKHAWPIWHTHLRGFAVLLFK